MKPVEEYKVVHKQPFIYFFFYFYFLVIVTVKAIFRQVNNLSSNNNRIIFGCSKAS